MSIPLLLPRPPRAAPGPFVALALLLSLSGCASLPEPAPVATSETPAQSDGRRLLRQAVEAHGRAAFARLHDINVAYAGTWSGLIKKIQPALVDDRYRGGSDERLLLAPEVTGQRHDGPAGAKQVARAAPADGLATGTATAPDTGTVRVWRNRAPDDDSVSQAAAAVVVDSYRLFLLGPLWVEPRAASVESLGLETVDGRDCDRLLAVIRPGLGLSATDRVELYLDRETHLLRRVRFSLDGLATTRGAVVQVDADDYVRLRGVAWPTHFVETVVRPIPGLKVHDWRVVGLDLDRGYVAADIDGPDFTGAAVGRAGGR